MINPKEESKVWLVTGASGGLGASLVKALLSDGQKVVAASRNIIRLNELFGEESENFLPLEMHIDDEGSVRLGGKEILRKFGTLDVIVNNAGFAMRGMIEEVSDQEARSNFDVNVFATLNVIRNLAWILREKRSGCIINISSIAGYNAKRWSGIYAATKFALEGISEALLDEMAPFGVKVVSVKPGDMRTHFHRPSVLRIAKDSIDDYREMREQSLKSITDKDGREKSSPDKIAERIIEIACMNDPQADFFLGEDSYHSAVEKTQKVKAELDGAKEFSLSVSCENAGLPRNQAET